MGESVDLAINFCFMNSSFLSLAWGFGDPHVRTLDGKEYTFNGIGEYMVMKTSSDTFVLQGRTAKVNESTATIFSAFAAAQFEESDDFTNAVLTSSVVHVERTSNDRLRVFVCCYGEADDLVQNGATFSGDAFREVTDLYDQLDNVSEIVLGNAALARPDEKTIVAVFSSGISVKVEAKKGLLDFVWSAPETFKGTTTGLLGVWDDDVTNDFTARNELSISINSTDRQIHNSSQTCMYTSVFTLLRPSTCNVTRRLTFVWFVLQGR